MFWSRQVLIFSENFTANFPKIHGNLLKKSILSNQNTRQLSSVCISPKVDSAERAAMMAAYSEMVKQMTNALPLYNGALSAKRLKEILDYTILKSKQKRSELTVDIYKSLIINGFGEQLPTANLTRSRYLGYCLEICNAMFCVADDIMDYSVIRRGAPSWHKIPNVGLSAINDSLLIVNCVYVVLKQHFQDERFYLKLMELFHETVIVTVLGEMQDLTSGHMDLNEFKMPRYLTIAENKTGFYTHYTPFAAALLMAGFEDPELFNLIKKVVFPIGALFQSDDDYMDFFFGALEVRGKVGCDIETRKCTWLAVKCMEHATIEQKNVMYECYGSNDPYKVNQIRQLYETMNINQMYKDHRQEIINTAKQQFDLLPKEIPRDIFDKLIGIMLIKWK